MDLLKIDPRLEDLFAPDAKPVGMPPGRDIGGGDTAGWGRGCDGPVWISELGVVAFNDIGHRRRLTWAVDGQVLQLHADTGGAVGAARDAQGRFVACEYDTRQVARRELDGSRTVVAAGFGGRTFANPDDVAIGPDGAIYFTDLRMPFPPPAATALETSGVYRVAPDLSEVRRLACDIAHPGGLALSGDGGTLYVSDQDARRVHAFALSADGTIGAARVFAAMAGEGESVPHGLCVDGAGNVYVGGPGGIWVFADDGAALGVVPLAASRVANLTFGGPEGATLYIATAVGMGRIETRAPAPAAVGAPAVLRSPGEPLAYPQAVERIDPGLDAVIAPGTPIRNHGHGGFWEDMGGGPHYRYAASLEGTFWDAGKGCLFFSDIGNNRRLRFDPATGAITTAFAPTGHTNGATLDVQGRVVQAEHSGRCISRLEADGARTVLVDSFEGRRLNHPNDVVVRSDGDIFFTDPWWDFGAGDKPEIGHPGVYHLTADLRSLTLVGKDYRVCNGLAFSHDEKILFVNDSYGLDGTDWGPHIRAYDVRPDGAIDSASSRIWAKLPLGAREGKPDGMKVDQAGNVYCGGSGGIWIFDRTGRRLGVIAHGDTQSNNLALGGPDWKTLYFVSWVGLHSIELLTPGIPLPPRPRP